MASYFRALPKQREQLIIEFLTKYHRASGAEIGAGVGLGPGLLYPLLIKMETRCAVVSEWADEPPPRRRFYSLPPKATP